MSKKCDATAIFPICGQFGAIRKPDFGRIVCKTYTFITSNLLCYKNWKPNLKISNAALTPLPSVKILFLPKNAGFLQKNAGASKIKRALLHFLKLKSYIF